MVASVAHVDVIARVRDEAGWSGRYAFMILMSAGIAVLGLLLSSPAVVIGAMLISPLMGPIIGLGFALATFDLREIRRSLVALAIGILLAVLFCSLVVLVSPLQNVTSEIAARTRPNLFDLMVALFSALAGSYATIHGRAGTVVGVAIATALMPPLAVVGFGLATLNRTVFAGALLLFFTNFMTIALAAAVMARLYSFGPRLSPRQTLLQSAVLLVLFVALAVPLGLALRQVAWEALASRQARDVLSAEFGDAARLSQIETDYDAHPIRITGTVFTPRYQRDANGRATATLKRLLGRDVVVALEQYRVGTGDADSQASQANAAAKEVKPIDHEGDDVAMRVALVAGVAPDAVVVDRDAHQATVRAQPLPGAGLASYRALEARVVAASPGWRVTVTPPVAALSPVTFDGDTPDIGGQAALADAIWGAKRIGLPIAVSGSKAHGDTVADALGQQGVAIVRGKAVRSADVVLAWQAPGAPR